jgi:flagellar biosynthesis protein FliQ
MITPLAKLISGIVLILIALLFAIQNVNETTLMTVGLVLAVIGVVEILLSISR